MGNHIPSTSGIGYTYGNGNRCERAPSASENETIDSLKRISTLDAADSSPDQDESGTEGDEDGVYVEVTILAKKLGTNPKTGTILLKKLLVWNYFEISNDLINGSRQFFMQHITASGLVELGICRAGPFGAVSVSSQPDCRIINFTGPDNNITMSNMDNSLFLRARSRQKDVVARTQPNQNSHFSLQLVGVSGNGAAIGVFKLVTDPSLAFKYDATANLVVIDTFDSSEASFRFQLSPPGPVDVLLVDNNKYETTYCRNAAS